MTGPARVSWICCCGIPFLLAQAAAGHPGHGAVAEHGTFAEMVWNPVTRSLEVALKADGRAMESALSVSFKKSVDLTKTPDIESLLERYLRPRFRVQRAEGKHVEMRFAGLEAGDRDVWCFFEFPLGEHATWVGCTIENSILGAPDHPGVHAIEFRDGERKRVYRLAPSKLHESGAHDAAAAWIKLMP